MQARTPKGSSPGGRTPAATRTPITSRITMREARASIVHDLLRDRPPRVTVGELLGTIRGSLGWADQATRIAIADLLIDGRARVDVWGRVEVASRLVGGAS